MMATVHDRHIMSTYLNTGKSYDARNNHIFYKQQQCMLMLRAKAGHAAQARHRWATNAESVTMGTHQSSRTEM